ncbi:MAG: hypothetical protein R3C59_19760 [Planctomycetaceae bacterium]
MAQPVQRIGNSSTDFRDFNQTLNGGGVAPAPNYRSNTITSPSVDLSRVDRRIVENLLKECVSESDRLYQSLTLDYQRYPEVRALLQDLVTLRARVARLTQDMKAGYTLERLQPDLKQLDSDWNYLSHQMSQSRQLSATTRDSVNRLDGLGRQLEKLFQMEPQLDRRALQLELARLDSALRSLAQELELDPDAGNRIVQVVMDARKVNQQAYRVQQMVLDQYPYAEIVSEYNRFGSMWQSLSVELVKLNNRFVERSMRDVLLADSNMHNLLWLEQQTSKENLRQITTALMRDVDEFYTRVPLKLLLNFKDMTGILQTSNDFYGTVQNFMDCVNRNEDERSMRDSYRYVEEYGANFVRSFEPLRSQAGRVVLREIEDGILALRNELNIAGNVSTIDTRAMIPTAASLENLAEHLDFDVRQWLSRDRQSFATQAVDASQRFVTRTRRIHSLLQARPTAAVLKKETSDLVEEWRAVYQYLGYCNTNDREHLRLLSTDISDAIYQLRVPLQF